MSLYRRARRAFDKYGQERAERAKVQSGGADPHSALSNPAADPDPTEWPDPYDRRPDPRLQAGTDGEPAAAPGATSTSQPHPRQDPEAPDALAPKEEPVEDRDRR